MELLAAEMPAAAELADGFLRSLASGTAADFSDDRLVAHQLGNLIEAYGDWTPRRASRTTRRRRARSSICPRPASWCVATARRTR